MSIKNKPFLKWAGGKSRLLNNLINLMPTMYENYFEPFIGSGALFFALAQKNAFIADLNSELINAYLMVQNNIEDLILHLRTHKNSESYYYELRNLERSNDFKALSQLERASRFIFLNKTCFNGLYRVNKSKGYFNVPYGKYKNPKICDENNLRNCNHLLKTTKIFNFDYSKVVDYASNNDFIYFDPPYANTFSGYTQNIFDIESQNTLYKICNKLTKLNVQWMLSNSDIDYIKQLYVDYNIHIIENKSTIGGKGSERKKINELIITNY